MPVAEHHDGFAMYDCASRAGPRREMGPKRDIDRRAGRRPCASRAWSSASPATAPSTGGSWTAAWSSPPTCRTRATRDFYGPARPRASGQSTPARHEAFLDDWLARTCELVDKYQPQLVWFDWWIEQPVFEPYLQRFAAYYYNRGAEWDKGVAINYKHDAFPDGTAVLDIERGQLDGHPPASSGRTTPRSPRTPGATSTNRTTRRPSSIIGDLVDIVSKNGALLLNIGPRPDGTIPEPEQAILLEIGHWLAVNGEAIYGTRPWKVVRRGADGGRRRRPSPTPSARPSRRRTSASPPRATRSTPSLLGWPEDGEAVIHSLGTNLPLYAAEIKTVEMIGVKEPLTWTRDSAGATGDAARAAAGRACLGLRINRKAGTTKKMKDTKKIRYSETPSCPSSLRGEMERGERDALCRYTTRAALSKAPDVVRHGSRYLIYYSLPPWGDGRANDGWCMGIAESRDLENWTPVGEITPSRTMKPRVL